MSQPEKSFGEALREFRAKADFEGLSNEEGHGKTVKCNLTSVVVLSFSSLSSGVAGNGIFPGNSLTQEAGMASCLKRDNLCINGLLKTQRCNVNLSGLKLEAIETDPHHKRGDIQCTLAQNLTFCMFLRE
ncbi:MAG: hypothetical protein GY862_05955 [Gammaproteobacteria bacterium]|nr:hypothetical protein [Gammaproteobacteria bacterium]